MCKGEEGCLSLIPYKISQYFHFKKVLTTCNPDPDIKVHIIKVCHIWEDCQRVVGGGSCALVYLRGTQIYLRSAVMQLESQSLSFHSSLTMSGTLHSVNYTHIKVK